MANILIFDSGMGGLSVYREVHRTLPAHQYFYLFDNACFPYGELSETRLVQRVLELLAAFVPRHRIDIVVIACNTASTYVLPALREHLSVPVVGVVPAIKPAAEYCRARGLNHLGLLATPGTVSRSYTAELVQSFAADMRVSMLGTTELVKMAEDKLAGEPVNMQRLARVLAPWRNEEEPHALVLGCTHFPLLAKELSQCLPHVKLVDSGAAIARRVASLLLQPALVAAYQPECGGRLYCTLLTEKARAQGRAFVTEGFGGLEAFCL